MQVGHARQEHARALITGMCGYIRGKTLIRTPSAQPEGRRAVSAKIVSGMSGPGVAAHEARVSNEALR
jgi:hypothetical protein